METTFLETNGMFIHSDAEALDPCTVKSLCALFIGGGGTSEGQQSILLQINIQNLRCFLKWTQVYLNLFSGLEIRLKISQKQIFFGEISECCGLSKVINKLEK